MRRYSLILILCLATLFSCQKAEFISESFIDDALEGVLITNDKDFWDGVVMPPKYNFLCDLIFYEDGTCRQCYRQRNGDEIVHLYHTLYWSIDTTNKAITLTDRKLLDSKPDFAEGVLKIERYKRHSYTLVGTLPIPNIQAHKVYEINGRIGTAKERAEYEKRYVSEDEFEE